MPRCCQRGVYAIFAVRTSRRRNCLRVRSPSLLAARDDGDHPEGRRRVHRGRVAVELQTQVLTRVGEERVVRRDGERAALVGAELEARVVHGLPVHPSHGVALGADVPLGGHDGATDDAGVRLDDVLHGRRPLELGRAVDRRGELVGRRHGTSQQHAHHGHKGHTEHRRHDAVRRDPGLTAGGGRVLHVISYD